MSLPPSQLLQTPQESLRVYLKMFALSIAFGTEIALQIQFLPIPGHARDKESEEQYNNDWDETGRLSILCSPLLPRKLNPGLWGTVIVCIQVETQLACRALKSTQLL